MLEASHEALTQQMEEMAEEHGGEEGLMADAKNDKDKINKINIIPVETIVDVLKVALDWKGKEKILKQIVESE